MSTTRHFITRSLRRAREQHDWDGEAEGLVTRLSRIQAVFRKKDYSNKILPLGWGALSNMC